MSKNKRYNRMSKLINKQIGNTQSDPFTSITFPLIQSTGRVKKEDVERISKRLESVNIDNKIDSILLDGDYVEKKLEDDDEYKKLRGRVSLISDDLVSVIPMSSPIGYFDLIDFKYDSDNIELDPKNSKE